MPDPISSSIDMIYKLDEAGHFTYFNPVMQNFFGLKKGEMVGDFYLDYIRADYRERVHSFYLHQVEVGQSTSYLELPIISPKGREFWLGQTVEVIQGEGEAYEFVVVARDISERIKATQSMLQSEQKYRSVIQNINLGLMEVDLEENIIYVNDAFCKMTGYSEEELLTRNATEVFLDPNDRELMKQMERANKTRLKGESSAYEMRVKRKDGSPLWMIISGAPVKNPLGEVVGSLGIHNDITERKEEEFQRTALLRQVEQSNRMLRENETRMRSVIKSALDAIIMINEAGEVLEWNGQAAEIFGFSEAETVGKKLSGLIIPEQYRQAHERGMEHFLKTGEGPVLQKRIEITAKHKKGHTFYVEISISPIKLEREYIFSAFVRDITLKKKSEEDMAQALHKQRELNELRSRLISMTSHEFRTPLTTIKSNIDLLQHKIEAGIVEPDKLDRNFKRMHDEIARLNHIMHDILLMGRLESGKMPYHPKPMLLHEIIESTLSQHFKGEGRITLQTTGIAKPIKVDLNMYAHVPINLLTNALKYSEGLVEVRVAYKFKEAVLQVTDRGIGIPERERERLFESFFRASNAEDKQGTGLGLALVKQFCDMHDFKIQVESQIGRGSTFTIIHPTI